MTSLLQEALPLDRMAARRARPIRSSAGLVTALLVFSAMPLTFGGLRLLQLTGIAAIMPPVPGHFGFVAPLVAHIIGALAFAVLGAFQFSPSIRQRWPAWHRMAGRFAWGAGVLVAISALWLTANYASPSPGGTILAALRIVVASAMLLSLVLALAAIRRRDIPRHREWMIRAYALGLGAATQMLVLMAAEIATGGPPDALGRATLMGLAWTVNLAVAEWAIRRKQAAPAQVAPIAKPVSA